MPDQNSTGDKVKFCCVKTPSCSKPQPKIISETVWSSNAFSPAGLSQGEFLFVFPAF